MAVNYLRNNNALIGELSSKDFSVLSPSRWQNELNAYAMYYQFLGVTTPHVLSVNNKLYGFCEQPDTYTIQPYYDVFTYFADKTHNVIWYGEEGTLAMYVEVAEPSLVMMPIPVGYDRMMYQLHDKPKEIIIKRKCIQKGKTIVLTFWDLYGQLQSLELSIGESEFGTEYDTDYRLANNGVVYYAMLHPKDMYVIGADYITEDLYDYYKGLVGNGAVLAMHKDEVWMENVNVSVSDASITTNVFGKNGFFSGKIEMEIGGNDKVIR